MDFELLQLLAKFPALPDSFKKFLIDNHYTTKDSWLTIPTEQNALKNHFAGCREFFINIQVRRTFQAILFQLNPEAAANEYKARTTEKQASGPMGTSNQTSGSPGTSFNRRTADNAPVRVAVRDSKSAQVHTSTARNTQLSQTRHVAEVDAVRTDGKSSRNPHQNNPTPTPTRQLLSSVKKEPIPAQSSPGSSAVAQRSIGGNVFQVSRPTATTYNSPKKEISQADSKQTIHNNSARIASLPTERIAILGRQTIVGTEYDACTNTYFDSKDNLTFDTKNFADNENLPEVQIFPFPQSLCDRLDLIGLNSNQKADYLVGLLENKLATSLANEPNGENDEEKVIVRYRFKSHLHSRNIAIGNYQPKNNEATHIVVGIEYGTEVVFVLSEKAVARQITLIAFLTEVIGRIKLMKPGGSMGMEGRFTKIKCQTFSNGDEYQARSFYHAAMILQSLMTESAGQKHIPQTAVILPLRQKLFSVSQETLNEIERFTEMTLLTSRSLTQLKASDTELSKIIGIDGLDAALKSMSSQVFAELKIKLICVRHGSADEKSIVQIFVRYCKGISDVGVEPKIVLEIGVAPPNQFLAESYLSMGGEECLKTLFPWIQSFDRQKLKEEVNSFVELFIANKGKEKHFCYRIKTNVHSTDRLFTCFLEDRGNKFIVPNVTSGAYMSVCPKKITTTSIMMQLEIGWVWKQSDNTAINIIPCEAKIFAVHVDKGTPSQTKKGTIPSDVIIDGLMENTAYAFTLEVVLSGGFTLGKRQLAKNVRTIASPAHIMISKSQPMENEPGFYALPKIEVARGTGFRRLQVGSHKINKIGEKVILVVGGTGSGKSTFINAMANYLYEIGFHHPFRLQLITKEDDFTESQSKNKAHSQTKMVSAYELNETRLPYRITIVDTPGFGDTEGLERDKLTMQHIKEWFERRDRNGLQTIDAVCTIIKATDTRLTLSAQHEMRLVYSLFGKDIKENMITAFTFCDNKEPAAAKALKNELVGDIRLNFNNRCFTELQQSTDPLLDIFWKLTSQSFHDFFSLLEKFEPKSVVHTLDVLRHRRSLEEQAANFSKQVPIQVNKIEALELVINQLNCGDYVLSQAQNFNIKRKRFVHVEVPVKNGIFTTYCKQCLFTCHENCKEVKRDNNQKFNCDVMNVKDFRYAHCTICPNRCIWTDHVHVNFIAKQVETEEEVTVGQVLEEYQITMGTQQGVDKLLELLAKDLLMQDKILGDTIKAIRENLNVLSEIALRPALITDSEYLSHLIEEEKQTMQQGVDNRVAVLNRHLKIVKLLEEELKLGGLLYGETESMAVAYLGIKFPKLYKKLALKGYFSENSVRIDNRPVTDEAMLERIKRNYPAEFHSIQRNPSTQLTQSSSKAMVVEALKRMYPSLTAATMRTLKEEADVDSVSGEETPSEHTVDAELAEQKRRIDEMQLNDKPKKSNVKQSIWKRIKSVIRR